MWFPEKMILSARGECMDLSILSCVQGRCQQALRRQSDILTAIPFGGQVLDNVVKRILEEHPCASWLVKDATARDPDFDAKRWRTPRTAGSLRQTGAPRPVPFSKGRNRMWTSFKTSLSNHKAVKRRHVSENRKMELTRSQGWVRRVNKTR